MTTNQKFRKLISRINLQDYERSNSATVRYYIQITSRYGVKFFSRKRACEECFFRQNAAHAMGFGPKALFKGIKNNYYYYVTEHALQGGVNRDNLALIRHNVSKMGWSTHDLFADNVGMVRDKPVLIDFDTCTIG